MSQDHFSTLGDPEHSDPDPTSDHHDDVTDVETSGEPGKRKVPPKLVAGAVLALGVLGFWGFKKFNAPSSAQYAAQASEQRQAAPEGGMMGAQPQAMPQPQPASFNPPPAESQQMPGSTPAAQEAGTFSAPPRGTDLPADAGKFSSEFAASGDGASDAVAHGKTDKSTAAALPGNPVPAKADSPANRELLKALADTNAKLDALTNRLAAIEGRDQSEAQPKTVAAVAAKPKHTAKAMSEAERARERAAGVVRGKPGKRATESKDETVVGYKIKQVIPGQAWLEDENGRQLVKVKGDKLGGSEIVEIDADKYLVRTTAGVIR